jgi:large subunit ribosomal protein LP0
VPHIIVNSYKNLLSIGVQTEYSFGPVDDLKERIKNPGAFASAAPAAAAAAPVAVAAPVVEEEESDDEMELDLFG